LFVPKGGDSCKELEIAPGYCFWSAVFRYISANIHAKGENNMNESNIPSKGCSHRARAFYQAAKRIKRENPEMSRRQFLKTAGATVLGAGLGAALGSRIWGTRTAFAHGSHEPVPIPGGTPVLGGGYHVYGPGPIDPLDAEPSTITDFNGFVGIAFIDGTVTRTNTQTGEALTLPMIASDMRFMKGEYRGMDGNFHHGTFGFI
jgi:hypothetical protein